MHSFLRLTLVGALCDVLTSSGFALLHYVLHVNKLIAQGIAFFVTTVTNYFLSRKFVFGAKRQASAGEALQFFILNLIALLGTVIMLWVLTDGWLHLETRLASFVASTWPTLHLGADVYLMVPQLLTGTVALAINFAGGKLWVFRANQRNVE